MLHLKSKNRNFLKKKIVGKTFFLVGFERLNEKNNLSINKLSNKLVESLINNKDRLGLKVSKGPLDCQIIDAGIEVNGSFEAGLKIAENLSRWTW